MSLYSKRTGPANNKRAEYDLKYLSYTMRRLKRYCNSAKHLYAIKDFVRAACMNILIVHGSAANEYRTYT